jgi:uroporphyrinogen decarboxylase
MGALARGTFDRLPIKHLADAEIDRRLARHFGSSSYEDLLDILGHDFREIHPVYCGPDFGSLESEHGIISGAVIARAIQARRPELSLPLAELSSASELEQFSVPLNGWYDYRSVPNQCAASADYATILGYCEGDFINGLSGLRGQEQVLIDIALAEPVYLELVERRFQAVYNHLECGLLAGGGKIDFVHFGEDLGAQNGPLLSVRAYRLLLSVKYRALFALAHRFGAKAMMHACGSVVAFLPALIEDGLDVLDVVQTNAVGMHLETLKQRFGRDLAFAGTMCVQKVLPFGTPAQVRQETRQRLELFADGGLIIGPSHQIQPDTPTENILAMYEAAGGLR